MAQRSTLRTLFDRAERLIGQRLERAVLTETFMDLVAGTVQALGTAQEVGDAISTALLHRFNLPAHTDLVKLGADVRRLEASVKDLADALQREPRPAPRRRSGRG